MYSQKLAHSFRRVWKESFSDFVFEVKNTSDWGTIPFIGDLSTGPAVISALSSSGGAENAHMFPFSLSYLTSLRGLAAYESDATTGVEGRGIVKKSGKRCKFAAAEKACFCMLSILSLIQQFFTVVSSFLRRVKKKLDAY